MGLFLMVFFGTFAISGLFFSHSVVAAVISLSYLLATLFLPLTTFRRARSRGRGRAQALRYATYAVLALNVPLFFLILASATM
jgi:hypothetical protein